MTIRLFAVAALMLLFHPLAATAQELSPRELKKIEKQAGKAFAAGDVESAAELYQTILAATSAGDSRRGAALYALAIAHLSPGAGRDVGTAAEHLEELASMPRHPRQLEAAAIRALFSEIDAARGEAGRHDAEVAEKVAALEVEREKLEAKRQAMAGQSQAAGGRVKSLEAQLRKLRAELSETQSELLACSNISGSRKWRQSWASATGWAETSLTLTAARWKDRRSPSARSRSVCSTSSMLTGVSSRPGARSSRNPTGSRRRRSRFEIGCSR